MKKQKVQLQKQSSNFYNTDSEEHQRRADLGLLHTEDFEDLETSYIGPHGVPNESALMWTGQQKAQFFELLGRKSIAGIDYISKVINKSPVECMFYLNQIRSEIDRLGINQIDHAEIPAALDEIDPQEDKGKKQQRLNLKNGFDGVFFHAKLSRLLRCEFTDDALNSLQAAFTVKMRRWLQIIMRYNLQLTRPIDMKQIKYIMWKHAEEFYGPVRGSICANYDAMAIELENKIDIGEITESTDSNEEFSDIEEAATADESDTNSTDDNNDDDDDVNDDEFNYNSKGEAYINEISCKKGDADDAKNALKIQNPENVVGSNKVEHTTSIKLEVDSRRRIEDDHDEVEDKNNPSGASNDKGSLNHAVHVNHASPCDYAAVISMNGENENNSSLDKDPQNDSVSAVKRKNTIISLLNSIQETSPSGNSTSDSEITPDLHEAYKCDVYLPDLKNNNAMNINAWLNKETERLEALDMAKSVEYMRSGDYVSQH